MTQKDKVEAGVRLLYSLWPAAQGTFEALNDGDRLAVNAIADGLEDKGVVSNWREVATQQYWPAKDGYSRLGHRCVWFRRGRDQKEHFRVTDEACLPDDIVTRIAGWQSQVWGYPHPPERWAAVGTLNGKALALGIVALPDCKSWQSLTVPMQAVFRKAVLYLDPGRRVEAE